MGETTRLEDLFDIFDDNEYETYYPTQKVGECESEYVVVKHEGSSEHSFASTDVDLYSILCYVPKSRYGDLEKLVQRVKKTMKKIYPLFIPYGTQTPSYYDDSIKAHMISIVYKNYKKI